MFDITVATVINVTFIDNYFYFEFEQKVSHFVLSSLSISFSTKANVVTNLNPLNSVNIFFSLFSITDSVSLSGSFELKEFKISIV